MDSPSSFCPYVGLQPYTEQDRDYFFGRDRDVRVISANLVAAPLTILYGTSGVGKSSVLLAGVVPRLRAEPRTAVVVFDDWQDPTFLGRLRSECVEAVVRAASAPPTPRTIDRASLAKLSLDDLLCNAKEALGGPIVILLDQFEEYFTYHPESESDSRFEVEVARALNRGDVDAHILVGLREEGLAKLDRRFRMRIPNLFANTLQLHHLDAEAATDAIRKPLEVYNTRFGDSAPITIEDELVQTILAQVRAGRVRLSESGGIGQARAQDEAQQIETPFLQLVMTRLWAEERRANSSVLRHKTLDELGGAQEIVRKHLADVMENLKEPEKEVCVRLFQHLVTPTGYKIAHTEADLTKFARDLGKCVPAVLRALSRSEARILRDVSRPGEVAYEIAHDVLAAAILHWRDQYVREKERAEKEEQLRLSARKRRRQLSVGVLVMLLLLMAGGWVSSRERNRAFEEAMREHKRAQTEAGLKAEAEQKAWTAGMLSWMADTQRRVAGENAREADAQRRVAGENADNAEIAKRAAQENADNADTQRRLAEENARKADAQRRLAEQRANSLTSHGLAAWGSRHFADHFDLALLLALEADRSSPTVEARSSILDGLMSNPKLFAFLPGHRKYVLSLAFSSDGQTLTSASADETTLLWDIRMGRQLRKLLTGDTKHLDRVALSPDGKTLASVRAGKTIILWDVEKGTQRGQPLTGTGHTDEVVSIAFSRDGRILASGSKDKTIILWDVETGMQKGQPLTGHTDSVFSVAFRPDGKTLASGSRDKTIILWDVETGKRRVQAPLKGHTGTVLGLAFDPDGKTLASGGYDKSVRLWRLRSFRSGIEANETDVFTTHSAVWSLAFSPDGGTLVAGSKDGTTIQWDLRAEGGLVGNRLGRFLPGHTGTALSLAFSPSGKTLVSGSADRTIIRWNVEAGRQRDKTLTSDTNRDDRVALSPDGKTLASIHAGKTILLWDAKTGQQRGQPLTGHTDEVVSIAFSPDGKTLASGSNDKTVILWDVETGERRGRPLTVHTGAVSSVAFSRDGKTLASGSEDQAIILWDAEKGTQRGQPLTGHNNSVFSVAFSPNGKTLASGDGQGDIILWDVEEGSGKQRGQPLVGHKHYVMSVAFSPDGKTLASGSLDGTVMLWDVEKGERIGHPLIGHAGKVWSVAFSPDGKTLASGDETGTITLWDVSLESWKARACRIANRNLTKDEWRTFFGLDIPYRVTCRNLPPGTGSP